jgi:SAM-dependent methyltransferase
MAELLSQFRMALPVKKRVFVEHEKAFHTLREEVAFLKKEIASLHELVVGQRLALGDLIRQTTQVGPVSLKPVVMDYSLDRCFQQLKKMAPVAFGHWHKLLDVNSSAYEGLPIDSCSVPGHPVGEKFRKFLRPYLAGTVLDIGCGPQAVPQYLTDHPANLIAGIDPLLPLDPHPFDFVQGTAEFLPWNHGTFDTVIASTSLDHILLLDRAMSEISRVLKPTGTFVVWVSFVPGAKEYNPYSTDIQPLDQFHLFHFDYSWFLTMMAEKFNIVELYNIDESSYFCSFRPLARPV